MKKFHPVAKNETLGQISKLYGVPLKELKEINQLKDINKIREGQRIYLRKEDALGVRVLLLDADRNPIPRQDLTLNYNGRNVRSRTAENGLSSWIYTATGEDIVGIYLSRLDGTLKHVANVISGYRNKLVTVVTPRYRVDARTEEDPPDKRQSVQPERKPAYEKETKRDGTVGKQEFGPKTSPSKSPQGKPVAKVEGDIPDWDLFLDVYHEQNVTDSDILEAAKTLGCDPGLIYAIAKQESAHSSFEVIGGRMVPKILYERHWFRKLTKVNKKDKASPYEDKYPDICGPMYHRAKRNKKKISIDVVTGKVANPDDVYGPMGLYQYRRMLKAYQLNPEAALQSCSWGKFQIMGFNFRGAGFANVRDFVKAMSRNEAEHIKAFLKFAKSNRVLLAGLKAQNFEMIAVGHNGEHWRSVNPHYAANIERFFREYKKK